MLVDFQDDAAPRPRDDEVREGMPAFAPEAACPERHVDLIIERDTGIRQSLEDAQLFALGQCLGVVRVEGLHVVPENRSRAEAYLMTFAERADEVVAVFTR